MTIFFTSDTHFSHRNIIHLGAGRPFDSIEEHNEALVERWNSVVQPDDVVYHLGDVALGPWPEGLTYVARLNGRKFLVPGNHDRVSSVEKEKRRERFRPDYKEVFEVILPEVYGVSLEGLVFLMSHYPYTGESDENREDRYTHLRPVNKGIPLIHGHTHSNEVVSYDNDILQISVGVDAWNFTPVSEHAILEIVRQEG